jgi:hypothetical protein
MSKTTIKTVKVVTLLFMSILLVQLASSSLALVFALPSSSGDWVVTGNEVVSNKVIIRNKIGYQTVKPPIRS